MTTNLQGSRFKNNWAAYSLITAVFAIDCLLGNAYKVIGSEDYVEQVYQYLCFKEMFSLIPYMLLVFISLGIRVKYDKWDISILFTCLILQILNCADFFINYNWRPVWTDWTIFFLVFVPSTIFKTLTYFK